MTQRESQLTDQIDLMRDEFKRIKASPGCDEEIAGLCDRALRQIEQHVPVIVQRDEARNEVASLIQENKRLRETIAEHEEQWVDEHI